MKNKFLFTLILFAVAANAACGGADATANQTAVVNHNGAASAANAANKKPDPPKNAQTPFEKALFSIRVGDFDQVLVFKRKDNGEFTEADKEFLRANQPTEPGRTINRWVRCDDGKCFIAGTNFPFTRENLVALQSRFDVKDYSQSNDGADVTLPEPANNQANANTK